MKCHKLLRFLSCTVHSSVVKSIEMKTIKTTGMGKHYIGPVRWVPVSQFLNKLPVSCSDMLLDPPGGLIRSGPRLVADPQGQLADRVDVVFTHARLGRFLKVNH